MSVFSKTDNNNTSNLVGEINSMLSEMRKEKDNNLTGGSSKSLVTEVNSLLSQIRGTKTNLTEDEVHDLAMQQGGGKMKKGGKKSKSKSKSKSKGKEAKKAKAKTKSKSKSLARPKSAKVTKSKSKSKSKSRGKKMSRSEVHTDGEKKQKGQYMKDAGELKTFIMGQLPKEKLNYIAMSKPVAALLKDNGGDVAKAKKNFDAGEFMKQYTASKKQMEANKEAKKMNK